MNIFTGIHLITLFYGGKLINSRKNFFFLNWESTRIVPLELILHFPQLLHSLNCILRSNRLLNLFRNFHSHKWIDWFFLSDTARNSEFSLFSLLHRPVQFRRNFRISRFHRFCEFEVRSSVFVAWNDYFSEKKWLKKFFSNKNYFSNCQFFDFRAFSIFLLHLKISFFFLKFSPKTSENLMKNRKLAMKITDLGKFSLNLWNLK